MAHGGNSTVNSKPSLGAIYKVQYDNHSTCREQCDYPQYHFLTQVSDWTSVLSGPSLSCFILLTTAINKVLITVVFPNGMREVLVGPPVYVVAVDPWPVHHPKVLLCNRH